MSRSQAAAMERARSQRLASEVPWPLPLRGLLDQAKTSEMSGAMSPVLENWQSNGMALQMRDGFQVKSDESAQQRIPFEIGNDPQYINIFPNRVECADHSYFRTFPADVSYASISSNIVFADGTGPVMRYDGESFYTANFSTDTGKSVNTFNGVFSHHDRIYLWDDQELAFYYGDIGAVMGPVVRFPLDRLGNVTGKVTAITSMTINAAHGMNDILVILTSTGMMILYEGLDPGDVNDWRLLGRVKVAAPVSKFAIASFGSDLWFLTTRGIVSARDSLAKGALALTTSVGKPISDLLLEDVKTSKALRGWQMHPREDGSQFLINVPILDGFKQYVLDVDAQAWSTSNYPASWWHDLNGDTDFTHQDGRNCTLSEGGDIDEDVTATFYTSWIRLPRHSEISYLIPTIIGQGEMSISITVLTDHDQTEGDIIQATQTVNMKPDNPGNQVALNEVIGVNAAGRVFQARFVVTGRNVSFESLLAGLV